MTRIELEGLRKTYPGQRAPAVDGLSLAVAPRELLALLGPSGSGKSTVLRLVAGFEAPDAGDVRLDGRSVLATPAHRRGAVLMFQRAYLFPFLSVAENVAFGLRAGRLGRAAAAAEVDRMLELVGLAGMGGRRPDQLSGGEQQRVALARALAVGPRVLLLDEPFSSLDPAVRRTLQEAVGGLRRELGVTAVLVTHDRAEALAMADRVALLERGRLVAVDAPRRLYERPPTLRAARQMGVTTFLRGRVEGGVLRSALGPLAVAAGDGPATFAIRPEHVALLAGPGPNAVAAEVLARTFRGDHVEYRLAAGPLTLEARCYGAPEAAPAGPLYAQLPAEALFAVEDDEEG